MIGSKWFSSLFQQVSKSLVSGEVYAEATPGTGSDLKGLGAGMETSAGLLLMVLAGGVALLFLVVPAVIWYFRRRVSQVDGKTQPVRK